MTVTYIKERMVTPDMLLSFLTQFDSTITLEEVAKTDPKAKGLLMAIYGSVTEFNVMNSHPVGQAQQQLLSHLVSVGAVTDAFRVALIAYANQEVPVELPPETTRQTIPFESRNHTFTLNQALPQTTSVVFWGVKNGYKKANLGRAIHVDEAVRYNVDLRVAGNYESVEVVVNAPNVDFVVS